jgi:hypothetical protein
MIQTNHVNVGQQGAQTGNPPTVAGLPKGVPVVDGIAPELSLRTETIGRHTGEKTWPTLLVQKKKLRVGPYVARVRRNEKGQVAHQRQPLSVSVRPQSIGLSEHEELCETRQPDLIGGFSTRLLQGCWLALDQFGWPFAVVHVPELGFKARKTA